MRATFLTLVFSFLFCLNGQSQNCLPDGITFTTQLQIDNFSVNYPGCTVIDGSVQILGSGSITNLNGLSGVTAIGNSLVIDYCPGLANLSGLGNLASVGGDVRVSNNPSLTSLGGLNKLASVGGRFWIWNNSVLTSLGNLNQLTAIGENLWISDNPLLTSLSGLDNAATAGGLIIYSNATLTNLSGLGSLTSVGEIQISSNAALTSLNGLGSIASFGGGGLRITNNPLLTSLNGLENITSVGGEGLYITSNTALTSLSGLDNITSVGGNGAYIDYNNSLENLNGLENLDSIGGDFYIQQNPVLTSVSGLSKLGTVGGSVQIYYLPLLQSLNGLENLTSIERSLYIVNMPQLANLSGLKNLASVGHLSIENIPGLLNLSDLENLSFISEHGIYIGYMPQLASLSGLEKVTKLHGGLTIKSNPMLTNLNALSNLTSAGGYVDIQDNPALSDCAIYAICHYLYYHPDPDSIYVMNNAPGCDSPSEIESQCNSVPVVVEVQIDNSGGACSSGLPVSNVAVSLQGAIQTAMKPTDANGVAAFDYLETGPFTLALPQVNDEYWSITQSTQALTASDGGDSFHVFLCLSPLTQCPELTANLGLPSNFRGCLVNSDVQVSAQNTGTVLAEAVKIAVVVPPVFELLNTMPPFSAQSGDTLFFEMNDLKPFETALVLMTVKTKCDTFLLEQTLCWETFATMDNPCPSTLPPHSEIKLSAECVGDTIVRLGLKNIGDAPTQNWHAYRIIRNDEILYNNGFSLNPQESLSFDFLADGGTWRVEATKFDDGTETAVALENCGGLTPGYITAFWLDGGSLEYDFDCRQVIGSYDPNRKTAVPTGVGWQGVIAANKPLQYTIDFQNTGTDTAFRVLLRDDLTSQLDINTFRPGFSSHPCTWEIIGNRLEVLFFPIALPDSNVNEPASHGFFNFTIDQKPNLPDGTSFQNTASIIFDYNWPIWTNTVWHTIGKLTVQVHETQPYPSLWRVWGNPVHDAAIFRTEEFIAGEKRFELYDAAGRLVRAAQFSGQEFEFQRSFLPGGLYFFRLSDAQGGIFTGKIVTTD